MEAKRTKKFAELAPHYVTMVKVFIRKIDSIEALKWFSANQDNVNKWLVNPKLKEELEKSNVDVCVGYYSHVTPSSKHFKKEFQTTNEVENYLLELADMFKEDCIHPVQFKRSATGQILRTDENGLRISDNYKTFEHYTEPVCGLCGQCMGESDDRFSDRFSDYRLVGFEGVDLSRMPFRLQTMIF